MACFIVPTAEAIVTTIVKKTADKKGNRKQNMFLEKMNWLNNMLWSGSALLSFEHVWHGEIVPWFPFLTKAANPINAQEMIFEMATSGVAMAILVTMVWVVMVIVSKKIENEPEALKVPVSRR